MSKSSQRLGVWRTRDELRAVTDRAVAIRKQLSKARKQSLNDAGGMDDALRLAETIEYLGAFGQKCDAEVALEIASRVETLVSLLEVEIDSVLTS